MKRRTRAGGKSVKTQHRKLTSPKRGKRRRTAVAVSQDAKIASLPRELQTSGQRWRSLLENPIFGVTFLDEHQRFISTNQAFQTMTGYSGEELRQMTPLDISVPGEREFNQTIRIFSSDEWRLRVARRMVFTIRPDGDSGCTDFCLISTP